MLARYQTWCNDKLRGRGATAPAPRVPQLRGLSSWRGHGRARSFRADRARMCNYSFFFSLIFFLVLSFLHSFSYFLIVLRNVHRPCVSALPPPSSSSPLSSLSCVVFVVFIPVLLFTVSLHLPYFPQIVSVLSAKLSFVGLCGVFVKSISRSSCTCLYLLVVLFDQFIYFY